MGYYAKKTLTGYREVPEAEADYYIQTVEEYQEKEKNIKESLNEKEDRINHLLQTMQLQKKQYTSDIKKMKADTNQRVSNLIASLREKDDQLDELQKKIQLIAGMNLNLRRIAMERANAKRGLRPKKEHPGYIILFANQYKQRYQMGSADVWHCRLQTPYDASLPLEQIEDNLWKELGEILWPMGVWAIQDVEKNGKYRTWCNDDGVEVCGIYRWGFQDNYRSGFWEFDFFTTKNITVPVEYRKV